MSLERVTEMANAGPINIQIDPVHLRTQIKTIIDDELRLLADKLWWPGDDVDPGRIDEWIENQVEARLAQRLKDAEK